MEVDDILRQFETPTPLKTGGQKDVYVARDPEYGTVAVKIGLFESPEAVERVKQEVEILREIDCPVYPKQYRFYEATGSRFVIVEQFIPSRPLTDCMLEFSSLEKSTQLIREIVRGLQVIWNKGIVHRDLKPDNILIAEDGSAKIIDLGVARNLNRRALTAYMVSGPGTSTYAAPEQFRPRIPGTDGIDIRADQFNSGIIWLQLLLKGNHPFDPSLVEGESIEHNIFHCRWYEPESTDSRFSIILPVIRKLLGREPSERYRNSQVLLDELNRCVKELNTC